jgi:hypothetical protein
LRYRLEAQAVFSIGMPRLLMGNEVTWSSSDPAIATIDTTGVLTGVAPGAVTISATFSGVTGQRTYTIRAR